MGATCCRLRGAAGLQPEEGRQIAILMTDGEFNTAFAGVPRAATRRAARPRCRAAYAEQLCDEMKKDGIEIFTIGFMLQGGRRQGRAAATAPRPTPTSVKHYYETSSGARTRTPPSSTSPATSSAWRSPNSDRSIRQRKRPPLLVEAGGLPCFVRGAALSRDPEDHRPRILRLRQEGCFPKGQSAEATLWETKSLDIGSPPFDLLNTTS